ncbi:MAG: hypothetical protein WCS62_03265 [Bacilli bacterium]
MKSFKRQLYRQNCGQTDKINDGRQALSLSEERMSAVGIDNDVEPVGEPTKTLSDVYIYYPGRCFLSVSFVGSFGISSAKISVP